MMTVATHKAARQGMQRTPMAGGEARLWRYVRGCLPTDWHAQRHEDRAAKGIPDVSWGGGSGSGWVELKYLAAWPTRPATPVRVRVTAAQVAWLEARGRANGGRAHLLLRVGRTDHLLFRWSVVRAVSLGVPRRRLEALAVSKWGPRIDPRELAGVLLEGD